MVNIMYFNTSILCTEWKGGLLWWSWSIIMFLRLKCTLLYYANSCYVNSYFTKAYEDCSKMIGFAVLRAVHTKDDNNIYNYKVLIINPIV